MPPKRSQSAPRHRPSRIPGPRGSNRRGSVSMTSEKKRSAIQQLGGGRKGMLSNMTRTTHGSRPKQRMTRTGISITHREYVGEVRGSVAFSTNSLATIITAPAVDLSINPGRFILFPWLCVTAGRYESYSFDRLKFDFAPSRGSGQIGSVMMLIDYDATDPLPFTKQSMLGNECIARSAAWDEFCLVADRKSLHKLGPDRFVRTGTLPAQADPNTFDCGRFTIATYGCSDDVTVIGELWVEYSVRLHTPNYDPESEYTNSSLKIISTTSTATTPFLGPTYFGGLSININAAGNALQFNEPGDFLVDLNWTGTTITDTYPTFTATGLTSTPLPNITSHNTAGTFGAITFSVRNLSPSGTLQLDLSPTSATVTATTLRIAYYQSSLS